MQRAGLLETTHLRARSLSVRCPGSKHRNPDARKLGVQRWRGIAPRQYPLKSTLHGTQRRHCHIKLGPPVSAQRGFWCSDDGCFQSKLLAEQKSYRLGPGNRQIVMITGPTLEYG